MIGDETSLKDVLIHIGCIEPSLRKYLRTLLSELPSTEIKGRKDSVAFLRSLLKKEDEHTLKSVLTILKCEHFNDSFESLTASKHDHKQIQQTIGKNTMHFIVVNEDVAYLRNNIEQITSGSQPSEDFTMEYYNRVQPFVGKTCFGYLDELDAECMEACDFQHKCAEKREEILLEIASKCEEDEYSRDFDARMAQTVQEIDDLKSNDLGSF